MPPFEALHGYPLALLTFLPTTETSEAVVSEFFQKRQHISQLLIENLQAAQMRKKQQANKKRTKRAFEVGDGVFLELQPYRQTSLAVRKSLKLSAKYYEPFQIVSKISQVAYKLESCLLTLIHIPYFMPPY